MGMINAGISSSDYEPTTHNGDSPVSRSHKSSSTTSEYNSSPSLNSTDTNSSSTSTGDDNSNIEEYLNSRRGKEGTITTSWSGFLSSNEDQPKRKKLLGE